MTSTEYGMPFNMPKDCVNESLYRYSAVEEQERIRKTMTSGVLPSGNLDSPNTLASFLGDELKVTSTEGGIIITKGAAICDGIYCFLLSNKTIEISEDGTYDIVVESDISKCNVAFKEKERTSGSVQDNLTRNGTLYQICLATVTKSGSTVTVEDQRLNNSVCSDGKSVCGIATSVTAETYIFASKADKTEVKTLAYDYGDIKLTACTTAPDKWLICDGSAISRTTYADLFAAIGTTYGAGDGSTTFNIPDLAGRVAIGKNSSHALGTKGGEETHTLTSSENGQHSHTNTLTYGAYSSNYANPAHADIPFTSQTYYVTQSKAESCGYIETITTISSSVGGQAHNNMQPYQTLNYIIFAGV